MSDACPSDATSITERAVSIEMIEPLKLYDVVDFNISLVTIRNSAYDQQWIKKKNIKPNKE